MRGVRRDKEVEFLNEVFQADARRLGEIVTDLSWKLKIVQATLNSLLAGTVVEKRKKRAESPEPTKEA